jgi:hypothetical protein
MKEIDILVFTDHGEVVNSYAFSGSEHMRLRQSVEKIAAQLKQWNIPSDINPDEVTTTDTYINQVIREYRKLLLGTNKKIHWLGQTIE